MKSKKMDIEKVKVKCRCGKWMHFCKRGIWKNWFLCKGCGDGWHKLTISLKIRDAEEKKL